MFNALGFLRHFNRNSSNDIFFTKFFSKNKWVSEHSLYGAELLCLFESTKVREEKRHSTRADANPHVMATLYKTIHMGAAAE